MLATTTLKLDEIKLPCCQIPFAIEIIRTGILGIESLLLKTKTYAIHDYPLRALIPYELIEIKGTYLPLNRDYKPIGISGGAWVDYEKYDNLLIPKERCSFDDLKLQLGIARSGYFLYEDRDFFTKKGIEKYVEKVKKVLIDNYFKPLKNDNASAIQSPH